jgi:hypothetical protein
MKLFSRVIREIGQILEIPAKIKRIQEALGRIESRQNQMINYKNFNDYEFRVFSQWGEDGLIQHLIGQVDIPNKIFIEFGVEDYSEANTRFLLENNNWAGLIIDGDKRSIEYVKRDIVSWAHNIIAKCAFITKENINEIITNSCIFGDIGLLSIDIDGNDYWVWEAIDCVSPRIVICEYNSLFGAKAKVTIPYRPLFKRDTCNYDIVYYGASLSALEHLGQQKGYSLVGSNCAGNNAFFVRNDVIGNLQRLTPEQAYKPVQFREYFAIDCDHPFYDLAGILEHLKEKELYNIDQQKVMSIQDLKAIMQPEEIFGEKGQGESSTY